MGIEHIFVWYQQKIGTYDKQKWETRIEQREQRIFGLNHIQTRSTKPNNDLIDLDLVRGSSFTKTKPKHGFIKVAKLATLRCVLFPFYCKWWIKQTSKYVFEISLLVYISQIVNLIIYFVYTTIINFSSESLSCMEIIVPFVLMWILSLIHSQIVATSPGPEIKHSRIRHRQYRRRTNMKSKNKSEVQDNFRSKREKVCNKNEKELFNHNELLDSSHKIIKKGTTKTVLEKQENTSTEIRVESAMMNGSASTDSESEVKPIFKPKRKTSLVTRTKVHIPTINITSQDSNCDTEDEVLSSPEIRQTCPLSGDLTSSATDWMGVTTNSEDCSYSSDMENISDSQIENDKDYSIYEDLVPTAILNPPSVKVSCIIWKRNEIKKADLSMVDISSAIIGKVDSMPDSMDYFYIGIVFSTFLAFLPVVCRIFNMSADFGLAETQHFMEEIYTNVTSTFSNTQDSLLTFYQYFLKEVLLKARKNIFSMFGGNSWEFTIMVISLLQRWILSSMIFFLLAVAERTFKQRLLYAKLFSHLTSSRRARKSELPHFRLNKVINIKTWLSVRSYLKKRGPQRSVDVIVSTAFIATLLLLTFLCVEVLKETVLFSQYYLEALIWCLGLGILLLRFMTLGTKINKKYRNLSVLITEQINLHLQIEHKPHKKDELNVANNVLKLAIDLLKELENPFKISGLSANPILYNVTKLVILSALSGALSEMFGFKLKLHKIKLK